MNNFIIAIILIAVAVIFTAVNSFYICSLCDEITALAESGKYGEAIALWEKKRDYIAFFIRDAEIDVVNSEADSLVKSYSLEDGEAEMAKMSFSEAISEIKHSEKLTLGSIFYIDTAVKKVYY
ncbi:MAG: hypothetical protein IJB49_08060 [Clostridia bacterium]|nr:hypothetical protein [Clostridia bacterium]